MMYVNHLVYYPYELLAPFGLLASIQLFGLFDLLTPNDLLTIIDLNAAIHIWDPIDLHALNIFSINQNDLFVPFGLFGLNDLFA